VPDDQSANKGQTAREAGASFLSAAGAVLVVGLGLAFVFVITLVAHGTVPVSH
jgi:hypothetical protein